MPLPADGSIFALPSGARQPSGLQNRRNPLIRNGPFLARFVKNPRLFNGRSQTSSSGKPGSIVQRGADGHYGSGTARGVGVRRTS